MGPGSGNGRAVVELTVFGSLGFTLLAALSCLRAAVAAAAPFSLPLQLPLSLPLPQPLPLLQSRPWPGPGLTRLPCRPWTLRGQNVHVSMRVDERNTKRKIFAKNPPGR